MADPLLTIGDLAARTGLAASALRYYEDLGLLAPTQRVSGRRRYERSAVEVVGIVLLLRDVGFSLHEISELFAAPDDRASWRDAAHRKIDELDELLHKSQVAKVVLEHALRCRHEELVECPNFLQTVASRLAGKPLEESVQH